ncbi:MAG: AtpZ/AtpI family protein [Defluviitoga tunisiensis]
MKKIDFDLFHNLNITFYFAIIILSNIFVGFLIGYLIFSFTSQRFWIVIFMFVGVISGLYSAVQEFSKEVDNHDRTQKKTKGTDNKNNYTSNN